MSKHIIEIKWLICVCLVKYISKAPYNGYPVPEGGRAALTFDSGATIELVNSDDPVWWEVSLLSISHMYMYVHILL